MQHSSGLYERLKNLSTPEDIEKWISERKKKYPTKANIEFKKSEELEKQQRGEVIEQTCLKSHKKLRTVSKVVEKKRRGRKRNRNNYKEPIICESKRYRGLIGFTGTSNLPSLNDEENTDDINAESSNIIISDEEDIPKTNDHAIAEPLPLLTLVANYGSDSDEDEKPMEEPIMKVDSYSCKDNINEEINTDDKSNINSDLNENVKKILNISQDKSNSESNKKVQNRLTQPKMDMRNSNSSINNNQRNKPQLLQRLLARDIQHERNLIFQCIKYITDNNFFD
ncbi:FMR1-interacting protein NUFIP1-like [Prorops nasuta]